MFARAVQAPFTRAASLVVMLLTGVATTALFTNKPTAFNRLCGRRGRLYARVADVRQIEQRTMLASVDSFYAIVASQRAHVAVSSMDVVAASILQELCESPVVSSSLVRAFMFASCESLCQNDTWVARGAEKSVRDELMDEFGIPPSEIRARLFEMASDANTTFPTCLLSAMAAVMGITFRVVSPSGRSQSYVCADSEHVDASITRMSEGQFALLLPVADCVPLSPEEAARRRLLLESPRPVVPVTL